MLLYPRDWSFVERRDVVSHLRSLGWVLVPIADFYHLSLDGGTVIRLLARKEAPETTVVTFPRVYEFPELDVETGQSADPQASSAGH